MSFLAGFEFLRQGFRERTSVGAVWPSSRALARAMAAPVLSDLRPHRRILEVGAGIGPITQELVTRLSPGDTVDIVELNLEFCTILRNRFESAPIVPTVHHANILEFTSPQPFHHIVSGLPLANFPAETVESIYRKFFELLEPGGTFVMFEHILFREALSAVSVGATRRRIRRVMEFEKQLASFQVQQHDVVFNMPPARVRVRRRPALIQAG